MPNIAVKNRGNGPCGEVLRGLLLAAASPDNLDAFLRRIISSGRTPWAPAGLAIACARQNAPFDGGPEFHEGRARLPSTAPGLNGRKTFKRALRGGERPCGPPLL